MILLIQLIHYLLAEDCHYWELEPPSLYLIGSGCKLLGFRYTTEHEALSWPVAAPS